MANMTTVPADNKSIIKGQPFSVVVSISGETNITDTVEVSATLPPGITLIKKFPGLVYQKVFSQQLIFQADESNNAHKIKFTSNSPNKAHTNVTYNSIDNPDLKPESCLLRGDSAYLYDPTPLRPGDVPSVGHPFISASINPMLEKGSPILTYDIPLRTAAPLRIFMDETMTEILPYKTDENNQSYYLIQKTSNAAVNLKIYATPGLSQFVNLDTIFNDKKYNQRQVIFMTSIPTDVSDNFEPPGIEETFLSSTLTRPDEEDDFTFLVPNYKGAKIGDFVIGFVTDDKKDALKKELFLGRLTVLKSGYYKFKVAYSDLYSGDNHISYIALNQAGIPERSKLDYINYDNGGINGPNPNDERRTLVAPKVYDQYGRYIGIYNPININSIGTKGLEVRLLSDSQNPDHTIAPGDMITITAYISHYVDIHPEKARPLPIVVVKNHAVKSTEITNGYYKATITPDKLMGYDAADDYDVAVLTIDYSRLAQNQKSKLFTRSFGTVAPGEGGSAE